MFMRCGLALLAFILAVFFSAQSWAVNPINFEGPKKTYKDETNKVLILWPGDFAVLNNVKGSANPKPDVVVPMLFRQSLAAADTDTLSTRSLYRRIGGILWDGDNKDNWPSLTDNTYFNNHYETNDTLVIPQQVVAGQFDGESASANKTEKDLVVVNWAGHISLCYNFVDAASPVADCESVSAPIYSDTKGIPLRAAVGDFNADGRDDVAVIGLSFKR